MEIIAVWPYELNVPSRAYYQRIKKLSEHFDICLITMRKNNIDDDSLDDFFTKSSVLPSGMIRTGVSDERILEIASNYDAVGITSIFSQQETQVLNCARLIKKNFL